MANFRRNVICLYHADACKINSVRQGSRKCELFFICHKTFVCCCNGSAGHKAKVRNVTGDAIKMAVRPGPGLRHSFGSQPMGYEAVVLWWTLRHRANGT